MLKKPSRRSKSAGSPDTADNFRISKGLDPLDFPAGRVPPSCTPSPAERTLTSNMTGQVSLTGSEFNLQFTKGTLKKISRNDIILFDKLNSRTRFKTNKGIIKYRNESAFAFEGENEYGLRTLQVPKQRSKYDCRVITDYTFSRDDDEEAVITITAIYPEFKKKSIIHESSLFEFRIENKVPEGIRISSDCSAEKIIRPETYAKFSIKGSVFRFFNRERGFELEISDKFNSGNYSSLNFLSLKSAVINGTSFLFINPGGSYTPAPSKYYSGIHEQLCLQLRIIKD